MTIYVKPIIFINSWGEEDFDGWEFIQCFCDECGEEVDELLESSDERELCVDCFLQYPENYEI